MQVTAAAHARLEQELATLLADERPALLSLVFSTEGTGDAGDEAGRVDVLMSLERLDNRVSQLRALLAQADIPVIALPTGTVAPGRLVTIRFDGDSDDERYLFGMIEERSTGLEIMTTDSPLGRALVGATTGTHVTYRPAPGRPEIGVKVVAVTDA